VIDNMIGNHALATVSVQGHSQSVKLSIHHKQVMISKKSL